MGILSTLRRGLAPALRPSYRAAVIAVANGEEIDDETLAEVCASRGPGKFTEDVRTYQVRVEAAQKLAEAQDLKKRELELLAERDAKRDAVAAADPPPRRLLAELYDAGRAYLAAKDERARLEDAATRTLVRRRLPRVCSMSIESPALTSSLAASARARATPDVGGWTISPLAPIRRLRRAPYREPINASSTLRTPL